MNTLTRFESLLFGIFLPFRAARLILGSPALIAWSTLPILITIVLYFLLFAKLQGWMYIAISDLFVGHAWTQTVWGAWIVTGVTALSFVLLIFAAVMSFSFGAAIVAAPFNDFLAEKAEPLSSPPLPAVPGPSIAMRIRQVWVDIWKSVTALIVAPFVFVGTWIPVLNIIAFGIGFLLITFQYISYPQTRRDQGISDAFRFLSQHFFAALGMGATLFFLFAIPFFSFLALPIAVVSGTLLVARARPGSGLPALH